MFKRHRVAAATQLLMLASCVFFARVARAQRPAEPPPPPAAAPASADPASVPAPAPASDARASTPATPASAAAASDATAPATVAPASEISAPPLTPARAANAPVFEPVLALAVAPDTVDPEALQRALAGELGVGVTVADSARDVIPTIHVQRLASGNVEVALVSRSLPRASRELVLRGTLEEQGETVALIASNMVRNEAAALLPDLRPSPAASVRGLPPPPAPKLASPCDQRVDEPFAVDLAPAVGSSSSRAGRAAVRGFSIGLVGTYSRGLSGVELSVGVNIKRASVCGAQLAAGANIVLGALTGAQYANVNFVRRDLLGLQLGTIDIVGGGVRGAQLGVVDVAGGHVSGAQFGVVGYAGSVRGLQLGVLSFALGHVAGFQGGVVNYAHGGVLGVQAGVANVSIGDLQGFQAAVLNVNVGATRGLQLGALNVSGGEVHGTQLGVINYADKSDASIGMLSIVRRGRTSFDGFYSIESGLALFSITHGGKYVHNLLGVGARTSRDGHGNRLAVMYGLGVRAFASERFQLDVDAYAVRLFRDDAYAKNTVLPTVRVPLTYRFFRGLGAVLAASYQVMITDDAEEVPQSLWGEDVFKRGRRRVYGFPGLSLGLRWEFDHGV